MLRIEAEEVLLKSTREGSLVPSVEASLLCHQAKSMLLDSAKNGSLTDSVESSLLQTQAKECYPRGRRPGMLMAALDKKDISFASTAASHEAQTPHGNDSHLEGLEEESDTFGELQDTPTFFDKLQ